MMIGAGGTSPPSRLRRTQGTQGSQGSWDHRVSWDPWDPLDPRAPGRAGRVPSDGWVSRRAVLAAGHGCLSVAAQHIVFQEELRARLPAGGLDGEGKALLRARGVAADPERVEFVDRAQLPGYLRNLTTAARRVFEAGGVVPLDCSTLLNQGPGARLLYAGQDGLPWPKGSEGDIIEPFTAGWGGQNPAMSGETRSLLEAAHRAACSSQRAYAHVRGHYTGEVKHAFLVLLSSPRPGSDGEVLAARGLETYPEWVAYMPPPPPPRAATSSSSSSSSSFSSSPFVAVVGFCHVPGTVSVRTGFKEPFCGLFPLHQQLRNEEAYAGILAWLEANGGGGGG